QKNKKEYNQQQDTIPDDTFQEHGFKEKPDEIVAKKAGVSTRTLERGKKIIEKASEDDKQKLREGKTSIAKVYQEIVNEEKPPKPLEEIKIKVESEQDIQNKTELQVLLERLLNGELYCPQCGNTMFECSKCNKTLQQLLKTTKNEEQ
ncbi:MAG: hypothetical protein LBC03_02295, partial [Nitrososphaerota archaeon]|nr:hypothetical protein [Nitrososphaerota archaeon]